MASAMVASAGSASEYRVLRSAAVEGDAILTLETPYGNILKTFDVLKRNAPPPMIQYCNIKAFFWLALRTSAAFAEFMRSSLPDGSSRVCIYMDDVVPGNVQRHDRGRTYFAYYYSLLDLPSFFQTSERGWFDLAFIKVSDCDGILGGISHITERLLESQDFPLTIEIPETRLRPVEARLGPACLRSFTFAFGIIMADEKAIKQILSVKGAGSYHPCAKCRLILGRLLPHDVPAPFQHYTCADVDLWGQYTFETFCEACDAVRAAYAASSERGREMETLLGINYEDGLSLPFSAGAARYRVPECIYWDPMHIIWASGGIAQYEVNHFLRKAVSRGVAWADLQGFVDQVKVLPDKKVGLSWNLQRRCVDNARKQIRAFAAEMLAAVPCLVAFGDMVMAPSGEMAGHLACLRLLYELQVLLFLGSRAHLFVDLLGEVVAAHHDMYLALYPLCRKPKNHYLLHLPRMVAEIRRVLTCFSAERHHKRSKTLAAHLQKSIGATLLRRSLVESILGFDGDQNLRGAHLGRPLQRPSPWRTLLTNIGYTPTARSRSLRGRTGWIGRNALILYKTHEAPTRGDGVPWAAGMTMEFLEATNGDRVDLFAVCRRHILVGPQEQPNSWLYARAPSPEVVMVHHERLLHVAPWVRDGNNVRAILPMYARRLWA